MEVYHLQRDFRKAAGRFAASVQVGFPTPPGRALQWPRGGRGAGAGGVMRCTAENRHLHPRPAQELGLDAGGYPQGVGVPAIEVAPDGGDFVVACRQRLEGGGWLVVRSRSDSLLWVEGPGPEGGEALAAS
jgi:hypothetical protein